MKETLIYVDRLSKKFCRNLKTSLWYGLIDLAREFCGLNNQLARKLRKGEFWALNDISFTLKRGECLGLIGPNGAGKSTLLRLLNGLIRPDGGVITIKGQVGALIALGAGFSPVLSGRENVYAAGAILGFSKSQIKEKYNSIVEFSELEDFMDSPVRNYSSGMHVRLGFSIAIHLRPDVLILDEVLAVGDISFQAKCFNAIYKMLPSTAVIFVSHSMPQISRICDQVLFIDHEGVKYIGRDVSKGIELYSNSMIKDDYYQFIDTGKARVNFAHFLSDDNTLTQSIVYGSNLKIHCNLTVDSKYKSPCISFNFFSLDMRIVSQCVSQFSDISITNNGNKIDITVDLGKFTLGPGVYWLSIAIQGDGFGEILAKYMNYTKLTVTGAFSAGSIPQILGRWTIINY
ncbi:polysaccharide ABC transporter ATP-binding protein [Desulfosediminicola sp.]|uniref:ABC transporter ATP-binding protein n=1 Tax=Desulfosediminicola sp. TaxID=2886825 RepID=UPI003AF31357